MERFIPQLNNEAERVSPTYVRILTLYSSPPFIWPVLKKYAEEEANTPIPLVRATATYLQDVVKVYKKMKEKRLIETSVSEGVMQQSAMRFLKVLLTTGSARRALTEESKRVSRGHLQKFTLDPDMSRFVAKFTDTITHSFPQADFSCVSPRYSSYNTPKLSSAPVFLTYLAHLLNLQDPREAAETDEIFFPQELLSTVSLMDRHPLYDLAHEKYLIREGISQTTAKGYWLTPKGWDTIQAMQFIEKNLSLPF